MCCSDDRMRVGLASNRQRNVLLSVPLLPVEDRLKGSRRVEQRSVMRSSAALTVNKAVSRLGRLGGWEPAKRPAWREAGAQDRAEMERLRDGALAFVRRERSGKQAVQAAEGWGSGQFDLLSYQRLTNEGRSYAGEEPGAAARSFRAAWQRVSSLLAGTCVALLKNR